MTQPLVLAVGPANFAGQAGAWASAARLHLGIDARSFAFGRRPLGGGTTGFGYAADVVLPHPRVPHRPLRAWWVRRALSDATHVALDGFLSLSGRVGVDDVQADVQRLVDAGRRVALVAHGSDVRDPDLHLSTSPTSYFRDAPEEWVEAARTRAHRNREIARASGLPLLVSTPDLCNDLPGATWLPLTVDVDALATRGRRTGAGPMSVLHVPSRATPPIKGTALIEPVLEDLDERGVIRWIRSGPVGHESFLELLRGADVVIDQLLGGSYGVTTVEAMAAGAVVVGNVEPHTSAHLAEAAPMVQATVTELGGVLTELAGDLRRRASAAEAQGAFVRRWHDGRAAAATLKGFVSAEP